MDQDVETLLIESIATGKLVVLAGAGLSMAAPTSAPSADAVAKWCRKRYLQVVGTPLPCLDEDDIEAIAKWFLERARFAEFIEKMLPWSMFKAPDRKSNAGHQAIADLLACNGIQTCVTTNFDLFVENAAGLLGEPDFQAIRESDDLPRHRPHAPYLKVHGCCYGGREQSRTIWCREQLTMADIIDRTNRFKGWLETKLQDRDLLIVGFWSDWAYLSDILADALTASTPRNVVVVDPESPEVLERKAPALWDWAHRGDVQFHHVAHSGSDFLSELQERFGVVSIARLIRDAAATYEALFGVSPSQEPESYGHVKNLYGLRRVLTGTFRNRPVRTHDPDDSRQILVALHARLLDCGASFDESHHILKGQRIRLVSGSGQVLSRVKQRYATEPNAAVPSDRTICVGASPDHSPLSIVRGEPEPTVIRPGVSGTWETHAALEAELKDDNATIAT